MVFHIHRRSQQYQLNIRINNKDLESRKIIKFLGVNLDEKLTWFSHIQMIKSKISKGLGIIYKAKKCLPQHTLRTLYYSFIYPYLSLKFGEWLEIYI